MRKDLINELRAERDRLTKVINMLDPPDEPAATTSAPVRRLVKPGSKAMPVVTAKVSTTGGDRAPRGSVKDSCYEIVAKGNGNPVSVKEIADALGKNYTQVYLTVAKDERLKKVGKALFALSAPAKAAPKKIAKPVPVAEAEDEEMVEEEVPAEEEETIELPEDEEEVVEASE